MWNESAIVGSAVGMSTVSSATKKTDKQSAVKASRVKKVGFGGGTFRCGLVTAVRCSRSLFCWLVFVAMLEVGITLRMDECAAESQRDGPRWLADIDVASMAARFDESCWMRRKVQDK
jgi:hypothetical protein